MDRNNNVFNYDSSGKIQSISDITGNSRAINYDIDGRVISIISVDGSSIAVAYDGNDRIVTLTDQSGRVWGYRYDINGNLKYVDNPDGTIKEYHYENADYPNALTGVTDERGVRYATIYYDSSGRAIASYLGAIAVSANHRVSGVSLEYNDDGSRLLTTSRGVTTLYGTTLQLGERLIVDISGPGCSTCGEGDTAYQHDAATNDLIGQSRQGLNVLYGGYDAKQRPAYKTSAANTGLARRTDYSYDQRFNDKINTLTEPSVFTP